MARTFPPLPALRVILAFLSLLLGSAAANAAPVDRISRPVDARNTRAIRGNLHRLAQPRFDRGAVDPGMQMQDVTILFGPRPISRPSSTVSWPISRIHPRRSFTSG